MDRPSRFALLCAADPSFLDGLSSARRNRLRLAYFRGGAPFGHDVRGLALWALFAQRTTVN